MWDRPDALTAIANFLYGVAAVALFYGVALVVIHLPVFPVRDVNVTGSLAHVTHAQLDAVVHRELRGNFFTISLEASGEAFEKLPWVRQVRLRRQWPDRLDVTLEEHEALARWGSEGLVNTHGEVFTAASDAHLPVFTGPIDVAPEIATQYARFQTALSPLGRQVAEIQVSDRRAWRITLDDGMTLELGRDRVAERVEKFVAAYAVSIARMREAPRIVDLRYPNGFAVRVKTADNGA
ncbi:MAG: cell division protein FtsQ/DivIB [Burkholderiales bacterium]